MNVVIRNDVEVLGPPGAPAMVFAHGLGCDKGMWRRVAPAFAETHRVVLFDHVGAGGSDVEAYDPVRHSSLAGYADDVLDLVRALDLGPVVLVGHSVSAMIGVLAAAAEPELFDRLVLVGPNPRYLDDDGYRGGFTAAEIDELLDSMDGSYLDWAANVAPVVMGVPDRPDLGEELVASFWRATPAAARTLARAMFLSDHRADLSRVRTPALVVQCRLDVLAPVEVGQYVHEQLVGSRLARLDAVGHCPSVSAPELLVAAMREYLAGEVAGQGRRASGGMSSSS